MTGSVLVLRGFLAKSWPPDTTVRHRISGHSISTAYNAPAADLLQEAPQRGKWERGKRKKGARVRPLIHFMRYSDDDLLTMVTRAAKRATRAVATLDTAEQSFAAAWSGGGMLPEPTTGDELPEAVAKALEDPVTQPGGKKRPKKK